MAGIFSVELFVTVLFQVKLAERVTADDIPLPPPSEMDFSGPAMTAQIPLPSEMPPSQQLLHGDQAAQPAKRWVCPMY